MYRTAVIVLVATLALGAGIASAASVHTGKAYAVAPFKVTGTIGLSENAARTLTVRLNLKGFKPGSRHIMHVHRGLMCASMAMDKMPMPTMGAILVGLGVHTADANGRMKTTFTVPNAPALKFGDVHVMVHYGPNISTESNARPMTCADVP
jgi:hypothetical protein